jgi:hypothetical protein
MVMQTNAGGNDEPQKRTDDQVGPADDGKVFRKPIWLDDDEHALNDEVISVLASKAAKLYQRGGHLVEVADRKVKGEPPRKAIREISLPTLRETISKFATFYSLNADGDQLPKRLPKFCYEAIAHRGDWKGIRHLSAVVNSPVLRHDGSIAQKPGYDAETGLFLDLKIRFPDVPLSPTPKQLRAAVDTLTDVVSEFPFAGPEHRAAWLAGLLTPLAREAYSGPTGPLFATDANLRGTGKTLLADAVQIIVTGSEAPRTTAPSNDEEMRKRITAHVKSAPQMILIDNIVGRFGPFPSLDAAITGTEWSDRDLGFSRDINGPLRFTWFASGNNCLFMGDTARRTCHIKLESQDEKPEKRKFKIPDIREHCRHHRGNLLGAALTILRAYFAAGRPDVKVKTWGSFEGWSSVVQSAVVFAGLPDPADTREEFEKDADNDVTQLRNLITAMEAVDPDRNGMRAGDMLKVAKGDTQESGTITGPFKDAIEGFCSRSIDKISGPALAANLRKFKRRPIGGKWFDQRTHSQGALWFIGVVPVVLVVPVSPTPTRDKEKKTVLMQLGPAGKSSTTTTTSTTEVTAFTAEGGGGEGSQPERMQINGDDTDVPTENLDWINENL